LDNSTAHSGEWNVFSDLGSSRSLVPLFFRLGTCFFEKLRALTVDNHYFAFIPKNTNFESQPDFNQLNQAQRQWLNHSSGNF